VSAVLHRENKRNLPIINLNEVIKTPAIQTITMKRDQLSLKMGAWEMTCESAVLMVASAGYASMEMGCRKKRSLTVLATSPLWLSGFGFTDQEYGIKPDRIGISIRPYMSSSQSICLLLGESFLNSEKRSITKVNKIDHFISVARKIGGTCETN
jgi:hypothetical protein